MKRMRKKGTYLQQGSRCSAAQPPARPSAVLGLAACTTLCGLTSQFTETPGLGEGTPSPSRAGGLGRKARPADPSHGQGGLLPLSRPPHSLPACVHISLSAPCTHPKASSPSPSLPWKRVHPAGSRRDRPEVPVWGKKRGGGRNSTCRGSPRSSVMLLHSHPAPSLTPFHAQLTHVPPSPLSTHIHTRCFPTRPCQLAKHPLSVPTAFPTFPSPAPTPSQPSAALSFPLYTSPPPFPSLPWEGFPGTGQGELARGLSVQGFPDFLVSKTEPRNTM